MFYIQFFVMLLIAIIAIVSAVTTGCINKNSRNGACCSGDIEIDRSVTSINAYAFQSCSSLTSVVFPVSVVNIGEHAFSYCSSLTSVSIPGSGVSIGSFAFAYCSSLTSVSIDSVVSIGQYAIYHCVIDECIITVSNSCVAVSTSEGTHICNSNEEECVAEWYQEPYNYNEISDIKNCCCSSTDANPNPLPTNPTCVSVSTSEGTYICKSNEEECVAEWYQDPFNYNEISDIKNCCCSSTDANPTIEPTPTLPFYVTILLAVIIIFQCIHFAVLIYQYRNKKENNNKDEEEKNKKVNNAPPNYEDVYKFKDINSEAIEYSPNLTIETNINFPSAPPRYNQSNYKNQYADPQDQFIVENNL